jgi:hypothetical protein
MDGHSPNSIVYLKFFLDPIVQVVEAIDADTADKEGLNGVVEVVARRGCNNTGQPP